VAPAVELVMVILLPTAAGYALILGARGWRLLAEQRYRRRHNRAAEPLEQLAARLRRLRADVEATETRSGLPAKDLRLRALRGAYIDELSAACRRLGVSPPPSGKVPLAEIYRVEADLRQHGLDVRRVTAR
jgi:hypothetical protein